MLSKEIIEELGSCISKQFPDEGIYRISRVEEWLATNGYTMEKLGFSDFHELIKAAPRLFGRPNYNEENYVIVRKYSGAEDGGHPADSFFGSKNIILNDDIIEMSQQSLYALTKVMGCGLTVQEMKHEIYDSFARAKEEGRLDFMDDRYVFRIGYCADGFQVNGIITKNISPRGKSLYFAFEKTSICGSVNMEQHIPAAREVIVSREDKEEIYRLLTANFQFDVPQHMAAVSKLLSDNHIDRSKYGFYKMKELLAHLDYLDMENVVLGGVPQIMVILRHSDEFQAAAYNPCRSLSGYMRPEAPRADYHDSRDSRDSRDEPRPYREPRAPETVPTAAEYSDIPAGQLEDFCNLPPKPLMILIQFIEKSGVRRDMSEIRNDLSEDFMRAKADRTIRFYDGKIIFPCRYRRSDGTPVELTLKPSTYEGKPWFLNFVDTISRDPAQRSIDPGRRLENFAFLGSWSNFLTELAEKAIPESWDFSGSVRKDYQILIQYIKYTFYRLMRENKICISWDRQFACFNTGLVDRHYDDIYACFQPNEPGSETEWKFAGFCTAASRTLGKQVVYYFSPLPQPPRYFEHGDQLFFDTSRQLLTDFDHIIIDNISRLPVQFLYDQFNDCPEAREIADELRVSDFRRRRELYERLKDIISGNSRLFIRIQNRLKDAIELAIKRVSRDYKTAVPSYYPKRNTMSLILPLCLMDEEVPDVALVVEQTHSGNYQGQTILTLAQAYIDARLLCRLNSEWLSTNIGNAAEEQEDSEENEDGADGGDIGEIGNSGDIGAEV